MTTWAADLNIIWNAALVTFVYRGFDICYPEYALCYIDYALCYVGYTLS